MYIYTVPTDLVTALLSVRRTDSGSVPRLRTRGGDGGDLSQHIPQQSAMAADQTVRMPRALSRKTTSTARDGGRAMIVVELSMSCGRERSMRLP